MPQMGRSTDLQSVAAVAAGQTGIPKRWSAPIGARIRIRIALLGRRLKKDRFNALRLISIEQLGSLPP